MCTNIRRITNKYTGESMYVPCGRCKACQQEKANARANRIKDELDSEHIALFVTLSYDRMSCPYFKLDDYYKHPDYLPVYRSHTVRYIPAGRDSDGRMLYISRRTYCETKLCEIIRPDYTLCDKPFFTLKKFGGRVGVCLYDDLKNFIKRFRINLLRNYACTEKIKFFACSEYGSKTKRPHFHLLLFVRPNNEKVVRECIIKSWPFAYRHRTEKYIQLARNAASYVATYVNCNHHIHPFLSQYFKTKHSYSKYFGFGNELYSLPALLEMLGKRDLSYAVKDSRDASGVSFVSCPKYVINRYFPIFKGFSSLSDSEIYQFIQCPENYASIAYNGYRPDGALFATDVVSRVSRIHDPNTIYAKEPKIEYSVLDLSKISVRLRHAYEYYHKITGKNRIDYAIDFVEIWKCYKATNFRLWRTDESVCELYKFDNLIDLVNGIVKDDFRCDYYDSLISAGCQLIISPNAFPQNINKTYNLSNLFDLKDKTRKVINTVMFENNHYV